MTKWCWLLIGFVGCCLAQPAAGVTIDWVTVGDPGNAADIEVMTCCGSSTGSSGYGTVPYVYRIGKYEVTNAQYVEFLNAVAATDTYGLYSANMDGGYGGITQSGSPGSYTYSPIAGREDLPVNFVSFYDALRFANWLHNGQGSGDTEIGAYTITQEGVAANSIMRSPGASIFLASEDEWYKAAYFNGTSYFDYPAGSDNQTTCASPGATANTANCGFGMVFLTAVGSYTGSASPNGTFDQGGNVAEWNEAIIGSTRGVRGAGSGRIHPFLGPFLAACSRNGVSSTLESYNLGFRVAMIPEPTTALLLAAGLAGFTAARRRRPLH